VIARQGCEQSGIRRGDGAASPCTAAYGNIGITSTATFERVDAELIACIDNLGLRACAMIVALYGCDTQPGLEAFFNTDVYTICRLHSFCLMKAISLQLCEQIPNDQFMGMVAQAHRRGPSRPSHSGGVKNGPQRADWMP